MNISLSQLQSKVGGFFKRYHLLLFFAFLFGGLSIAVLIVASSLTPQDDGYVSNINNKDFDKATINRLESLRETEDTNSGLKDVGPSPF